MDVKTSDWRPGPTVCRCCLTEGCYKDISTEYFWMGKREVYAEMLSETLNVSIAYSQSTGPNSNSRLICEPCISRLRDATDFRRQVLECEKTFMQHLDPGSSSVQKELRLTHEDVKLEKVKQEKRQSDDEDFDDRVDFVVDNDDDDDDLDDEPLMKLASKVPKKEVDLMKLLDSSQITVKRKATTKSKEPPTKKTKKQIILKPSASKAAKPSVSSLKVVEKKKKGINIPGDLESKWKRITSKYDDERANALTILIFSNVCPFKYWPHVFVCYCCDFSATEIGQLRQHVDEDHPDMTETMRLVCGNIVKADITDLTCEICFECTNDIPSFVEHLMDEHNIFLDANFGSGIMSFRLPSEGEVYKCAHCDIFFESFMKLNCHMNVHYTNCKCSECGKNFADVARMKSHKSKRHKRNTLDKNGQESISALECEIEKGDEFFTTRQDERDNALIIMKYSNICPFKYCNYKFVCSCCPFSSAEIGPIREHVDEKHKNLVNTIKLFRGYKVKADVTGLKCKICFEELENISALVDHLIEIHDKPIKKKYGPGIIPFLLSNNGLYKCDHCDLAFKSFLKLNCHINIHYHNKCAQCGRFYADVARLKSHMFKRHNVNYIKSFKEIDCRFCNKKFTSHHERLLHIKEEHQEEKEYRCSLCPATFKRSIKRTLHFRSVHMTLKPFACNDCPYRCVAKEKLRAHIRTHTGEMAFQCEECGKTYSDPKYRAKHMRIHLKERFNCSICSSSFLSIDELTDHLKTHYSDDENEHNFGDDLAYESASVSSND